MNKSKNFSGQPIITQQVLPGQRKSIRMAITISILSPMTLAYDDHDHPHSGLSIPQDHLNRHYKPRTLSGKGA